MTTHAPRVTAPSFDGDQVRGLTEHMRDLVLGHQRPHVTARAMVGLPLVVLVAALLCLVLPPAAGWADGSFGSLGSGAGQLDEPEGIAADEANGDLYVADTHNDRIDEFNSAGKFVMAFGWGVATGAAQLQSCTATCQSGLDGAGAGEFESPQGIAVDNDLASSSYGDIFVVDRGNHRIEKFSPSGAFLLAFGGEVDKTTHADICTASSGDTCGAGSTGTGNGQFEPWENSASGDVAIDSSGAVWVGDLNRVQRFEASGAYVSQIDLPGDYGYTRGLAVDSTGDVYVASGDNGTTFAVRKYDPLGDLLWTVDERTYNFHALAVDASGDLFVTDATGAGYIYEYNASGTEVLRFAYASQKNPNYDGIVAYHGTLGEVYVTSTYESGEIAAYSTPAPDPVVVAGTNEASPVGNIEATLNAQVDPEGAETSYHFQYVDSADFEHDDEGFSSPATKTSAVSIVGPNFENDEVSSQVGGLAAETTYHFRILLSSECEPVAHPSRQCTVDGEEATFTTLPPASIDATTASRIGFSSAELRAEVNPLGAPTVGYFEYVSEALYDESGFATAVEVPDVAQGAAALELGSGSSDREVSVGIAGLEPGTSYRYRFVASNSGGTADGPAEVLTTFPVGITGLPDGRVYEEVTPAYKNGNFFDPITGFMFGLAEAGGNAVLYPMSGAIGTSYAGIVDEYVSRHTPGVGWTTTQATSRPFGNELNIEAGPTFMLPSADFTKFLFADQQPFVQGDLKDSLNIFLNEDSAREPLWLSAPQIEDPIPALGKSGGSKNYTIVGASPDLGNVYFAYAGTLLPEDAERAAHIGAGTDDGGEYGAYPWGFYEWSGGALREAGTLPDGELSQFGAIPAALGAMSPFSRSQNFQATDFDNVVSESGSRAFFVSPDPNDSSVTDPSGCKSRPSACTSEPPELYMREAGADGTHRVALVSQSTLPGSEGKPAPDGAVAVASVTGEGGASYAFASGDGSRVFFASGDRLTEAAPANSAVKEYEFNVETGALTYLPGVEGPVVVASRYGSSFLFVNTTRAPWELELWRGGSQGGTVEPVAELPEASYFRKGSKVAPRVRFAHVSVNGEVFVFESDAPIPGFNDEGETHRPVDEAKSPLEVFRYDAGSAELNCLSCPPKGIVPDGDAYMSYNDFESNVGEEANHKNGEGSDPQTTEEPRGMSADGSRVFFDTPTPLSPEAVNGQRDVYEWENGRAYLISSGAASEESYYLDSSESGGDVFFATSAALVPGDTDGAYDIYDARIPQPGDNPPPVAVPCKGSICQGPPSVPQLLGAPASETFSGVGNLAASETQVTPGPKPKAKAKKKKKARRKSGKKLRGRSGLRKGSRARRSSHRAASSIHRGGAAR